MATRRKSHLRETQHQSCSRSVTIHNLESSNSTYYSRAIDLAATHSIHEEVDESRDERNAVADKEILQFKSSQGSDII